jgi:hypothetical protein
MPTRSSINVDSQPQLLVWNYTTAEKSKLDAFLQEIGAPSAVTIEATQGCLTLREIIDGNGASGETFTSAEKVVLFHGLPQQGVLFLINFFKQTDLPRPIYAVVTEHSINWPFNELLEHLVEERDRMEKRDQ